MLPGPRVPHPASRIPATRFTSQDHTDPNTVYLGSALGGMWKTNNFFTDPPTWTPISRSLPTTAIGSAALGGNPKRVYLSTGDGESSWGTGTQLGGYVCVSNDGGATWQPNCSKLKGAFSTTYAKQFMFTLTTNVLSNALHARTHAGTWLSPLILPPVLSLSSYPLLLESI